jgi:hypothetical protein
VGHPRKNDQQGDGNMGQITLKQETNQDLLKALRDRGYIVVDVEHEHDGNHMSHYRVVHPDLQGHFRITDRYDYFENLGKHGRSDCRFWINSDYERVDRERSEGVPPTHTIHHEIAQEPEECLTKMAAWVEHIKSDDEKWIIGEWHEPVRYIHPMSLCDFTLASGVEIWKPVKEAADTKNETV